MTEYSKICMMLVMGALFLGGVVSSTWAEDFIAEGLTEPVRPRGDEPAVTIAFPGLEYNMEFDPPRAKYVTPEGIGFSNEWAETASQETEHPDWGEVLFDRDAVMWLEQNNPARKVVRFRGVIKNPEGEVLHTYVDSGSPYGEGDWSDEWYYVYPDGVSVRVVKIYTGKTEDAVGFWGAPGLCAFWGIRGTVFETQETFIHGIPGKQPPDIIEQEALTLITMDGEYKRIDFQPYPPDCSLFDPANIQMVNLKSKYHPFTIVRSGNVEIKPYYMPMDDHRNLDQTRFITWPRRTHFENGDYTSAISHVIKWDWLERNEKTLFKVYLLGLVDDPTEQQRVDKLVNFARNWEKAPQLYLQDEGYNYDGYEIKEKAYILTNASKNKPKDLHVSIMASPERPLINPAFVIKEIGNQKPSKLTINDTEIKDHRVGFEGDNMVLWIPLRMMREASIKLQF